MNRKITAGFEMVLMIGMVFSLCYFVGLSEIDFVSAQEDEEESKLSDFLDRFGGGELIENSSWQSYPISSSADGAGCCFVSEDGQVCGTAAPENCIVDSPFAEGALCAETSFCEKGCCYDEASGIYDKNVLEFACPTEWIKDPNCNMPGAALGCCVLGAETIFETEGQCEVDSLTRAIGDNEVVDWRGDVGEGACLYLSATQNEGACVIGEGGCKFVTEADCFSYDGDFTEGYLCTAPSLNTSCEMTEQTKCIDGSDRVFFVDSCGNRANVYDSARVAEVDYWDMIAADEDVCGATDFENGNADNPSCGNCDRFAGGLCSSAIEDNFDVDVGNFYCRDMDCMFDGEEYNNGESWCVYDGAIGEGNDVVGSRHWKYVCSQGVVQIEPCADYRNQICIQQTEFEVDGQTVEFNNAACIANNWRECINLNSEDEDAMEQCDEALNCRVDTVDIADKFTFDICLPDYPGGFALNDERYQSTAENLCKMADQKCTVIQEAKTWGGCSYVANEDCLYEGFAQEMNDFCRGLGDCGGSVNIVGDYSGDYSVLRDGSLNRGMFLSDSWVGKLVEFMNPVPGQYAVVEDYSEYLDAAGIWGVPGAPDTPEEDTSVEDTLGMIQQGLSGIATAAEFAASGTIMGMSVPGVSGGFLSGAAGSSTMTMGGGLSGAPAVSVASPTTGIAASASAFAGYAMGAGMGMVVGIMIAKQLGLSPGGTMLMAIGGAMVGAQLMGTYMAGAMAMGPIGWIGLAIMIIASFFMGDDCPPIEIDFECRPWQPVIGGDNCDACNGDPLKPCSAYRCNSLGAGCELINEGTGDELCIDGNPNDVEPPVIRRNVGIGTGSESYEDSENGFSVAGQGGGCLAAYEPFSFGVVTSEPAQCKYDLQMVEFGDMSYGLGGNSYLYNHSTIFSLPDPSHGQSQGSDWTGDLTLYVLCQDRYGIVSPGYYQIDMCVAEGEDVTGPKIVATEGADTVSFDASTQEVLIVTNELSTCKWDFADVDYLNMGNDMACEDSFGSPSNALGYACSGTLPVGDSTDYYIRCMDQPWEESSSDRNSNSESYILSLVKPSSKISIDKIAPSEDYEISTDFTTIDLKVATNGGADSHFCSYSFSGYDTMIQMFETGDARTHEQTLNIAPGEKKIYVECHDETGDFARNMTEFKITRDSSTPAVARVWQDGGFINLVLTEEGECKFSFDTCKFAWSEGHDVGTGTELRFGVTRGEKYYIRCTDSFGNTQSGCSVEVMAT